MAYISSGVRQSGQLVMLDYDEAILIDQPYASKLRNPVQELLFNWRGQVELDPASDNTPDITQLPDVQVDFSGYYDAIEMLANETGLNNTMNWGSWTGQGWRGNNQQYTRTGIKTTMTSVTENIQLGNTIENISARDYMRSRLVRFTGVRMKPDTRVWAYFDDEKVFQYCTPTDANFTPTGKPGDPLVTDSTGSVYGTFRIPDDNNLRFRVGTKRFVLKDIKDPATEADLVTTSGHGEYQSNPLDITMRGTNINMQVPQFSQQTVVEKKTLHRVSDGDRSWWDPIAQSFTVNISGSSTDGAYITRLDIFLGKKDSKLPLTMQVREMDNGFPTQTIVPYGLKTVKPEGTGTISKSGATITGVGTRFTKECWVDQYIGIQRSGDVYDHYQVASISSDTVMTVKQCGGYRTPAIGTYNNTNVKWTPMPITPDASIPLQFKFDTPVFLKNQSDYAFVTIPGGNSDQYTCWVAEMGGIDVYRPNTFISKQTYSGVLFSSSNDKTWNPIQDEDMKFNIWAAEFSTNDGNVYLENNDNDFFTISEREGTFFTGEDLTGQVKLTFANSALVPNNQILQSKSAFDGNSQTDPNFANGVIRTVVDNGDGTVTVTVDSFGTFTTSTASNANRLYFVGNSNFIGATTTVESNSALGQVDFFDTNNDKLYIKDSTGGYKVGGWVRGQTSGGTAQIVSIDDLQMNDLVPKIPEIKHTKTNTAWSVRTAASGTINPTYKTVQLGVDNFFYDNEKTVYSKSNEDALTAVDGSTKSLVLKGTLSTENIHVSPIIDLGRSNIIVLGNVINNDDTNEDKNVGNALVRYISKKVTLADGQDAEDMVVYMNAYKPQGTDIKVYARIHNPEDGEAFNTKAFTPLTQITAANVYSTGFDGQDVKEYEFGFAANTVGTNYNTSGNTHAFLNTDDNEVVSYYGKDGAFYRTYKTFSIKIVMTASGTELIPNVDDIRAIAVQK